MTWSNPRPRTNTCLVGIWGTGAQNGVNRNFIYMEWTAHDRKADRFKVWGIASAFCCSWKGGALKTCPLPKDGKTPWTFLFWTLIYRDTWEMAVCFACWLLFTCFWLFYKCDHCCQRWGDGSKFIVDGEGRKEGSCVEEKAREGKIKGETGSIGRGALSILEVKLLVNGCGQ